ncbi:uncharacterized protein si:ch211-250c4.3 isoform X1 [Haplochromis burtoni]|uniref:uncharacterized protein si:ch211-250c4.3 isoform X1 n=2 Tax=Haplochromis burtoni TaxID=8153 RepID=UPI0003BD6967|nr:uncharacterized protein si:ch211-250c4.3 isoform X1 [Haplochromis burtoni]
MSVKKKAALVISWQKSFSIMAPWRKGKGGSKNTLLDSEVVLTKMKLFIDQDNSHPELNSQLDEKPEQPQIKPGSKYPSAILSDTHLSNLFKCESEDSGVELPSGAHSPSTPTGSEQSFVVHSRESSCDSSNLNSEPTVLSDRLVADTKSTEKNQANDSADNSLNTTVDTQDGLLIHSNTLISSAITVGLHIGEDVNHCRVSGPEQSEDAEESRAVTGRTGSEDTKLGEQSLIQSCDDMTSKVFEPEPIKRSITSDSLEEYMDECCRLSKAQQVSPSPLSSGLSYLEHICQLVEKISQMQETNLQLQRQICSLQKECRMRKAKEDFFKDYCSCGAASLAFQDFQKTQSRDEFSSPSGTLSDLSAVPEVTQHPLISTGGGVTGGGFTLAPPCRKSLSQRSHTEGEVHRGSTEGLSIHQHTLSENSTWARVKDVVRKTKLRNHSRLGAASASLKMSCPQLYRPDLGPVQSSSTSRNSMVALGHRSTLDFPWLE